MKRIILTFIFILVLCGFTFGENVPENSTEKTYYDDGQVAEERYYKDGKEHGIQKSYYKNGQLRDVLNFRDGKLNGIRKSYYENGQLKVEGKFKENKIDGVAKMYDESGQLLLEINYKDDKVNGTVKSYYEKEQFYNEAIDPSSPMLSDRKSTITQETIRRIKRGCEEAYPKEVLLRFLLGPGFLTEKGAFGFSKLEVLVDSFDVFLKPKQKFIDLGSGDGRVVLLASLFEVEATGIEFDNSLYNISIEAMKNLSDIVDSNKVNFIEGDFLVHDLSSYDVFYIYQGTEDILGLKKKLSNEMKVGSILISNGHNESVPYDELLFIQKFTFENEAPISVYKKIE